MKSVKIKIFEAVILVIFLLSLFLWTYLLHRHTQINLGEMEKVKTNLLSEVMQNRRDMHTNRVEIAMVRGLFIPKEYHITLVPLLVPGKLKNKYVPEIFMKNSLKGRKNE